MPDIAGLWENFFGNSCADKIKNKLVSDIFCVYSNFENAGKNNEGMYTVTLGCEVSDDAKIPEGFGEVIIPTGNYRRFFADDNSPESIGKAWTHIWELPQEEKANWRFECEFECYVEGKQPAIYIGQKS